MSATQHSQFINVA